MADKYTLNKNYVLGWYIIKKVDWSLVDHAQIAATVRNLQIDYIRHVCVHHQKANMNGARQRFNSAAWGVHTLHMARLYHEVMISICISSSGPRLDLRPLQYS